VSQCTHSAEHRRPSGVCRVCATARQRRWRGVAVQALPLSETHVPPLCARGHALAGANLAIKRGRGGCCATCLDAAEAEREGVSAP
jgi:hypothetical protein